MPLQRKTVRGVKWCTIEGCPRPHLARGWCATHYQRWKTTGDPGGAELLRVPGDPDVTEKACKRCKQVKPLGDFPKTPRTRDKRESWCKDCHKPGQRNRTLLRKYGVTAEWYDAVVSSQGGKCGMCAETATLVVDHCHKSGKVRALLCDRCNRLLGVADDKIDLFKAAIAFLEVHNQE